MAATLGVPVDVSTIIEFRHDLHRHPELMFDTIRTSQKVCEELTKIGVEFKNGLAKGTGVVGWLPATADSSSAATIALRADMDALPIVEATGKPYASTSPGKMHACGHDGHTAILVGTAAALANMQDRPNNVLFLFQPAEEGGAGGDLMCKDGALDGSVIGKRADMIYGLHGWPELSLGRIETRYGPLLASADQYIIKVNGRGGHAAFPHRTLDPVVVAAHIVTALQSIVSRNTNPLDSAVVTIGRIEGGSASNVIPEFAVLEGTLRTLDMTIRDDHYARIETIAKDIASAFGARATLERGTAYPVTHNEERATNRFFRIARETFGSEAVGEMKFPVMGAEDFSFYGAHVPACFFCLGLAQGDEPHPLVHTPQFDFNDDAIILGIRAFCALATSSASL